MVVITKRLKSLFINFNTSTKGKFQVELRHSTEKISNKYSIKDIQNLLIFATDF